MVIIVDFFVLFNSCATGDLSGKLGRLTFDPSTKKSTNTVVDLNLPLGGVTAVVGKALQIISNTGSTPQVVACSLIRSYSSKTGKNNTRSAQH
jgi:hypothetical protein